MAVYVFIHGAGDSAANWAGVGQELRGRGHEIVAVDLPCEDESAGWWEYADTVAGAIGARSGLVVVAHSLGGFVAPLVCARVRVDLLVLLAAMIPAPGETANDWWENAGYTGAEAPADDEVALFLHDVPPELAAEALARGRDQAERPLREPWPLDAWPDVPTRYLLCRDDRCFPAAFARRHAEERLGLVADEIDGGHMPFVSRPAELADRLEAMRAG